MTNRKLGLLLLPLIPLSAIGIVELVNRAIPVEPTAISATECEEPKPITPPRFAAPPFAPAPQAPQAVITT